MKILLASVLSLFVISALAYSIGTAETIRHLTVRENGIVCAIDVLIRDSKIIKKETQCFLTK